MVILSKYEGGNMSSNFQKYDEVTQFKVIKAFFYDEYSHRKI